ncbi:MAG: GTPase [Methanosarcinales archaeon]
MSIIKNFKINLTYWLNKIFKKRAVRIGIYGPPNAGKCLAKGEKVILSDGTKENIENIFQRVANIKEVECKDLEEYIPCSDLVISVPSLNIKSGIIENKRVSHVYRQKYNNIMYAIKTQSGKQVIVSPEHPFIELLSNIKKSFAKDIKKFSKIAVSTPEINKSILWDSVIKIKKINYNGYIYDLTVEDNHTFLTGNGIIVHNTTLANQIIRDWTDGVMGQVSNIPHETRRARRREGIVIETNNGSITLDIVDTPGLATKIDFHDFMKFGLKEEEAKLRAKEATEGVIEAIKWLDDLDGVILVMDSCEDPFTQVNVTIVGNMEARKLPLLIVANKIDLPNASPSRIKSAFPQHPLVPISALKKQNMDLFYEALAENFG